MQQIQYSHPNQFKASFGILLLIASATFPALVLRDGFLPNIQSMQMDSLPSDLRDGVNSQLFWSKWVIKLWPIGSLLLFASGSWLLLDGLKKWTQVSKSIDALEDRDRELKNKKKS